MTKRAGARAPAEAPAKTNGDAPKRQLRPRGEVRRLLLAAARTQFAERGYTGAVTRDIAQRAGVSEALLFRHFGTKAQLFQEAVLEPFNESIAEFVVQWQAQNPQPVDNETLMRLLLAGLYDHLKDIGELVTALMSLREHEAEAFGLGGPDGTPLLSVQMDEIARIAQVEAEKQGFADLDYAITARLTVGMVFTVILLDRWMWPAGAHPDRDRLLDEMVKYALYGVSMRPGKVLRQGARPRRITGARP